MGLSTPEIYQEITIMIQKHIKSSCWYCLSVANKWLPSREDLVSVDMDAELS
jgi:hypothetical protein